mgnify:CR=1 FL=1
MLEDLKKDAVERMQKCVVAFRNELKRLRTGRAHPSLLEHIRVEYYGNEVPLNQVATVSTPEPRMLSVQVWDKANVNAVEKGIARSNLGLNPIAEGTLLRLPIPALNAERRSELAPPRNEYASKPDRCIFSAMYAV